MASYIQVVVCEQSEGENWGSCSILRGESLAPEITRAAERARTLALEP